MPWSVATSGFGAATTGYGTSGSVLMTVTSVVGALNVGVE